MNNDISAIDKDPVAVPQALDPGRLMALPLESGNDTLSDGPNMNVGAPACDDHDVSKGGFAVQVDFDDVLGLRIFETSQDSLQKWPRPGLSITLCRLERLKRRLRIC
jgi:hypothetical protein